MGGLKRFPEDWNLAKLFADVKMGILLPMALHLHLAHQMHA